MKLSMTRRSSNNFRTISVTVVAVCLLLLGYAYWLQFVKFLDPCPLCIFQRIAFMALAVNSLIAAIHNPVKVGRRVYAIIGCFFAVIGGVVAGRHVWLQSLPPDQIPECGPGLDYLLEAFPLVDAIAKAFSGSGECATVDWSLLSFSMPAWTLLWFVILGSVCLISGLRR